MNSGLKKNFEKKKSFCGFVIPENSDKVSVFINGKIIQYRKFNSKPEFTYETRIQTKIVFTKKLFFSKKDFQKNYFLNENKISKN